MEALLLLSTLGPASAILGVAIGANLRGSFAEYALKRFGIWLAVSLLVWLIWPNYSERLVLWKHMLIYTSIFASGMLGGIAYAKALTRDAQ